MNNEKVIGVITARMSSTRLPKKVLMRMAGKSVFALHAERMKKIDGISGVFLATSTDPLNRELIEEAQSSGCGWYAGAEQDIVDRHIKLCEREQADAVIRVTCDSPVFDFESASCFVAEFKREYFDYIYVNNMTMIQGTLSELVSYPALLKVHEHYRGAAVTAYIKENPEEFKTLGLQIDIDLCRPEYRLTIDQAEDIEMINRVYSRLYRGSPLSLREVYAWLDDNPGVASINSKVGIKECEQHSANLLEKPLYSIVHSGKNHVILDGQKRSISLPDFLARLKELFPGMGER